MADYSLVSIGGVYLTDDGLVTGSPCRVIVQGLDQLRTTKRGANTQAADGSSYMFVIDGESKGYTLVFNLGSVTHAVVEDLYDAINALIAADDVVAVTIDGDEGTFALDCQPVWPNPIAYSGDTTSGLLTNVVITLITVGVSA